MPETKHRTTRKKNHNTKYLIITVHHLSCEMNGVALSWKKLKCDQVIIIKAKKILR